eukprot:2562766-Pyramimonas_sp.AAC.1
MSSGGEPVLIKHRELAVSHDYAVDFWMVPCQRVYEIFLAPTAATGVLSTPLWRVSRFAP